MSMAQNNMNAISMLNEMQQKHLLQNYDLREAGRTGSDHEPVFKIVASAVKSGKKYEASATASSKKAARESAAVALLEKLGIKAECQRKETSYDASKTAVSILNEYAQQRDGNDVPVYTDVDRWGEDHCPTFKVKVQFRGKSATGTGSPKKAAKEAAAQKLLEML